MLVEGWVTKMGAVVRNWKMRFMILQADGTLLYVSAGTFRAGSAARAVGVAPGDG